MSSIIDTIILGFILSLLIFLGIVAITSFIIIFGYYLIPVIIILYIVGWLVDRSGFEL